MKLTKYNKGGASGIGFAAAVLLAAKGATVHILDNKPEDQSELTEPLKGIRYHQCNIASWPELRAAFENTGKVDIAIANAGVSEEQHTNYFDDVLDADGKLEPCQWGILNVNYIAVLDFVKLAWSNMRRHKTAGSIVITTSTSSYMPEQALPVYSSGKAAVSLSLSARL